MPFQVTNSLRAIGDIFFIGNIGVTILIGFGFFYIWYLRLRRANTLLIGLPILINIIFASIYFDQPGIHYFATIYPLLFLIIGLVIADLIRRYKNNPYILGAIFLSVTIYLSFNGLNMQFNNIEGSSMPKGWNLSGVKKVSNIIANDASNEKTFNIAATLDGDTRARSIRYMTEVYGDKPNFLNISHLLIRFKKKGA